MICIHANFVTMPALYAKHRKKYFKSEENLKRLETIKAYFNKPEEKTILFCHDKPSRASDKKAESLVIGITIDKLSSNIFIFPSKLINIAYIYAFFKLETYIFTAGKMTKIKINRNEDYPKEHFTYIMNTDMLLDLSPDEKSLQLVTENDINKAMRELNQLFATLAIYNPEDGEEL